MADERTIAARLYLANLGLEIFVDFVLAFALALTCFLLDPNTPEWLVVVLYLMNRGLSKLDRIIANQGAK